MFAAFCCVPGWSPPSIVGSASLAAHEKITDSYVARMLTLTPLAPNITQAILEGRQPKGLKLATLLRGIPLAWEEQRRLLGFQRPESLA